MAAPGAAGQKKGPLSRTRIKPRRVYRSSGRLFYLSWIGVLSCGRIAPHQPPDHHRGGVAQGGGAAKIPAPESRATR